MDSKKNVLISVIVPVYNVEKYLHCCLDSILAQTYKNWECILVDDGSTDASGKICDEYKKKDSRIKVFHKENSGISATREFAIQHACGMYIQFVDSDDWIDSNMLERMYQESIKKNSDIIGCNFIEEYEESQVKHDTYYNNKEEFLHKVIANNWGVLWKIMFKRQLFVDKNIHFPKNINGGEDYYVVTLLLLSANRTSCIKNFYPYHYRRFNSTSFMTTPTLEKTMMQVEATDLVEIELKKRNILNAYMQDLIKRKASIKSSVMAVNLYKGCKVFSEINKWYVVHGNRKKFRLATLLFVMFITHSKKRCYK